MDNTYGYLDDIGVLPGIQVKVVNSYAAIADFVFVKVVRRVDLPTEGKPIILILALPNFETSNPASARN